MGGARSTRTAPLQCISVLEGRSKPVLCVNGTDELLFSRSKDQSCKMWNLVTGQEIASLKGHLNNVVSIKYCSHSGLVFTISTSYIKLFGSGDLRGRLCRDHDLHHHQRAGRALDQPITLNPTGIMLYAAARTSVRIWELNRSGQS
ncbi:kinesin-like protein KIF21B [Mauremys mutica]|uniref:kinesin-like protein KIF21B n=1 Tax=Mauremys mutica TaxID=74926 RepID=UPI001D16D185|nr:kinesin-like protein KIF21B [Mauremys mutica]